MFGYIRLRLSATPPIRLTNAIRLGETLMKKIKRTWLLVCLGALAILALGAGNAFALGEAACGSAADADGDCLDAAFEATLTTRFAPLVRLHPRDSYRPSSVEFQVAGSSLSHGSCGTLFASGAVTVANLTGQSCSGQSSGLSSAQTGFVLGASGSTLNGNTSTAKCYAHVGTSAVSGAAFDVQYWFNYPKNGPAIFGIGAHNGDWEHVTVRVNADGATVKSVFFARHGDNTSAQVRTPGDGKLAFVSGSTTRPIVYSTQNGHASYPTAGIQSVTDYTANGGPTLDCSGVNAVNVGEKGLALNGAGWLNYSGVWGSGSNAPSGPAYHGDWFASARQ